MVFGDWTRKIIIHLMKCNGAVFNIPAREQRIFVGFDELAESILFRYSCA